MQEAFVFVFLSKTTKKQFQFLTHLHKAEIAIQKHTKGGDLKTKWGGNCKGKVMG